MVVMRQVATNMLVFVILLLTNSQPVLAMDSETYRVKPDTLNSGGGYSSSETYRIWHNIGESPTGTSQSESYKISAGFYTPDDPTLLCSLSANTINFGLLRSDEVTTGQTVLTIATSAISGYTVSAYDDTEPGTANGMIDATRKIADATTPGTFIDLPLAGVEHYGHTVTGSRANPSYLGGTKMTSLDNTTSVEIASHNSSSVSDTVTVQYRTSISNTTPAAPAYRAITTFICTSNF